MECMEQRICRECNRKQGKSLVTVQMIARQRSCPKTSCTRGALRSEWAFLLRWQIVREQIVGELWERLESS